MRCLNIPTLIASMLGLNAAHCRQIFHRAQQHLAADRLFISPPDAHLRAVERFLAAHDGDLPPLTADDMLVGSSAN